MKILITLSDREGGVRSQELVAEDLGEEDIVGDAFGFEAGGNRRRRRLERKWPGFEGRSREPKAA